MTHLIFQNHKIETVELDGKVWLLPHSIGGAAGLSNPVASIANIYRANKDEFTEAMTRLISLPDASGSKKTRVYSLRGAYFIGMRVRTPQGKVFRRWVLDVLEQGRAVEHNKITDLHTQLTAAHRILLGEKGRWYQICLHQASGRSAEDIARLIDKSPNVVKMEIENMARIGLEREQIYEIIGMRPSMGGPLFEAIINA